MKLVSVWLCVLHETSCVIAVKPSDIGCVIPIKLVSLWLCDSHETGLILLCDPCVTGLTLVVWFLWNWSLWLCDPCETGHFGCVIPVKLVSLWLCDWQVSLWLCDSCVTGLTLVLWFLWNWTLWLCDPCETGNFGCVIPVKLVTLVVWFLWNRWFLSNWSQSGGVISLKLVSPWLCDFCEKWSQSGGVVFVDLLSVWLRDFFKTGLSVVVRFLWNWSQSFVISVNPVSVWLCDSFQTGLNLVWFLWIWSQSDYVIPFKLVSVRMDIQFRGSFRFAFISIITFLSVLVPSPPPHHPFVGYMSSSQTFVWVSLSHSIIWEFLLLINPVAVAVLFHLRPARYFSLISVTGVTPSGLLSLKGRILGLSQRVYRVFHPPFFLCSRWWQ